MRALVLSYVTHSCIEGQQATSALQSPALLAFFPLDYCGPLRHGIHNGNEAKHQGDTFAHLTGQKPGLRYASPKAGGGCFLSMCGGFGPYLNFCLGGVGLSTK